MSEFVVLFLSLVALLEIVAGILMLAQATKLETQRRLLARVERANVALGTMITIDATGLILQVSREVATMFGYEPFEVLGQKVNMLMPEPDKTQHDSYLKRLRETGEKRIIGIGRVVHGRRKDGTIFPAALNVFELGEADGGPTKYYQGVLRDISHEKWAELAGIKP